MSFTPFIMTDSYCWTCTHSFSLNLTYDFIFKPESSILTIFLNKKQSTSQHFYRRDAMLVQIFATATCLSVCLSHAGIVPSRAKAGSWILKSTLSDSPITLVSSEVWFIEKFARGHPKGTCKMRVGWVFSAIFDQYRVCRHISKTVHFRHKVTMGR